jgi:two-component system OmpR family response regulator
MSFDQLPIPADSDARRRPCAIGGCPSKCEIVVVDDDLGIRETLDAFLRLAGFRVHSAANGQEALALLETVRPAVLFVDLYMPVMDGTTFRRGQLSNANTCDIPFVLMTAEADGMVAATELMADAFVSKPFDAEDLFVVISQCCRSTAAKNGHGSPSRVSVPD